LGNNLRTVSETNRKTAKEVRDRELSGNGFCEKVGARPGPNFLKKCIEGKKTYIVTGGGASKGEKKKAKKEEGRT